MTLTNVRDFIEFLNIIPKDVMEKVWLFPLRQDRKNPDVPSGTILKGNLTYRLTKSGSVNRLKWGKNVGIYALTGGLMFLDLDVENGKLLASQSFLEGVKKNPSFTIQTRNGGFQRYFLNNGEYNNQVIKENGLPIGELRTDWYYVVSVGSYVTPDIDHMGGDGTYRLVGDCRTINQFHGIPGIQKRGEQKTDTTIIGYKPDVKTISIQDYIATLEKNRQKRVKK